jgi:hypothetical protein
VTAPIQLRPLQGNTSFERELLLLTLTSPIEDFDLAACARRPFTCLCAMDASGVSVDDIAALLERLLILGCAYLCAWGPDCDRVHDIMDEIVVGDNPPDTDRGLVMTTWHTHDTFEETLWFLEQCTFPAEDKFPNGADLALILCIGNSDLPQAVRDYLNGRRARVGS